MNLPYTEEEIKINLADSAYFNNEKTNPTINRDEALTIAYLYMMEVSPVHSEEAEKDANKLMKYLLELKT